MSNLRWKLVTILLVFVVFFGVGVYPILASRYSLPALLDTDLSKLGSDEGLIPIITRQ